MKNLNWRLRLGIALLALSAGGIISKIFDENMFAQYCDGFIVGAAWAFTTWYKSKDGLL